MRKTWIVILLVLFALASSEASSETAPARTPVRGTLLIADKGLQEPTFHHAVVLLLGSGNQGAMGLIINHPTHIVLSDIFEEADIPETLCGPLFLGGPVSRDRLFFLVRTGSERAPALREDQEGGPLHIFGSVYLIDSRILARLLESGEKTELRMFAGYSGWGEGQLEREIARGDWKLLPGNEESVFSDDPSGLWQELYTRSGAQWVFRILP